MILSLLWFASPSSPTPLACRVEQVQHAMSSICPPGSYCCQPSLDMLMDRASMRLELFRLQHGRWPRAGEVELPNDSWGTPLEIVHSAGWAWVVSRGADGRPGNVCGLHGGEDVARMVSAWPI